MADAQGGSDGRAAQRRRTRRAIVDAAAALVRAGRTPTVDEVAAAADVSRRTVYVHFPTLDQLLLDATLGALSATGSDATAPPDEDDAVVRVDELIGRVLDGASATLPLGRQLIRLTVDADPPTGTAPRRGYRRVEWIEDALEPLRDRLDGEQFDRLTSALTVLIGFESMVVLRDVRGADAETEARVVRWAARALITAMLAEAGAPDA